MITQISCPRCQTPFNADIHQVVDVAQTPQLKYELLNGTLNVFTCPSCGMTGQMATPLLYHDPEHELFMVHVPMELNLGHEEQQQLIGRLVQEVMSQTPAEQRRAYMLQPQEVIGYQTFLEKVLETEGITPEMIARQRQQAELLQKLATVDRDVADVLLEDHASEIDETFFAMLRNMIESAQQQGNDEQLLRLINLQARLYRETELGRELEARQSALRAFQKDVRQEEGLTPELLVKHVLQNIDDEQTIEALVAMGQPAFNYDFFSLLTEKIEQAAKEGNKERAKKLTALRQRLLDMHKTFQEESQQVVNHALETLQTIVEAEDRRQALMENMGRIDDTFMYVLSMMMAQAENEGRTEQLQTLGEVQDLIIEEAERQVPPQIRLINRLMRAETDEERRSLLDENAAVVTPELSEMLDALIGQIVAEETGTQSEEAIERLRQLKAMIATRV